MLLSGLSLAVEEIFWYFRHIKAPIPKIGKKISEDDFKDNKYIYFFIKYLILNVLEYLNLFF